VQSDAKIVNTVLDGNKEAFAILVRRYEQTLRGIAMQVRCDREFAADVSQQTFMTAYEKLSTLRNPAAFGVWIMRIARRYAIESVIRSSEPLPQPERLCNTNSKHNGTLDEEKQQLLSFVMKLPEQERQVIMLRYFADHKVREVAAVTGRTIGTITKQLSRAHQSLRALLQESKQ
jgi:RNA polymerase sigma factor (sigma-70 family)